MSNTLGKLFIFAAGAVVGSVATWKLLEARCEKKIQEEVDAYKDYVRKKIDDAEAEEQEELEEYETLIDDSEYIVKEEGVEDMIDNHRPYIIPPDELGDEGYDIETLTYYADNVLTNELDKPISDDNVDKLIGRESLNHFGDYERDSVHVRNDAIKKDYEILLDTRAYSSFHCDDPHESEE